MIWRKAIDLESHAQLIAFCTWSYGKALSWPTTRSVCSDTFSILWLPCMWMRNQSCEPSLAPQHQRCDGCGWLTLASHVDAVSCVKCNRFAVDHYTCHRCSVWSPNGRICYKCVSERESGCIIGNHSNVEMECLNEIANACADALDHLQMAGNYTAGSCYHRRPMFAAMRTKLEVMLLAWFAAMRTNVCRYAHQDLIRPDDGDGGRNRPECPRCGLVISERCKVCADGSDRDMREAMRRQSRLADAKDGGVPPKAPPRLFRRLVASATLSAQPTRPVGTPRTRLGDEPSSSTKPQGSWV